MKHYLNLVPISAKVHKKQSRMTRICIILAVFLVTAIFGMADMEIKGQKIQAIQTDGKWHAVFQLENDEQAAMIAARPTVLTTSWYGVINYKLDLDYNIGDTKTAICGFDKSFLDLVPASKIEEGRFPKNDREAVVTKSVKNYKKYKIGDTVKLKQPNKTTVEFTITGFADDTSMLTEQDVFGLYLNTDALNQLASLGGIEGHGMQFYVEFSSDCNIQKEISDIGEKLGLTKKQIGQNTKLLGLIGQSNDSYMMKLYEVAGVLAFLVIVAGVLMITGSLNSNISQRTEFFGMMRCLGATKKQVIRYVRLEALNWCKTAIPFGLTMGIIVIWILCGMLKYLSPSFFSGLPTFGISWISILIGITVGILTVLFAAQAPAKRASKVSPLTAVSGNANMEKSVRKAANTSFLKVDTALGIHHAKASRKNFVLMVGSFAFSIILFLSFTVIIDFMNHAIRPVKPYTPDISIISTNNSTTIPVELKQKLEGKAAVKRVYGRMFAFNVPIQVNGKKKEVNLISYEQNQFNWAEENLLEGTMDTVIHGSGILTVYKEGNEMKTGSPILVNFGDKEQKLTIAGVLSDSPFVGVEGVETIICSEKTFRQITGETNYTVIDLQLNKEATDKDVVNIRKMAGENIKFSDQRMKNREAKGSYYSFALFTYGFLTIIALISVFNIINSIAMSVSARLKQYGVMRAIGMDNKQLIKIVAGEAAMYTFFGIIFGCIVGLPINKILYEILITSRWGQVWYIPVNSLCIITSVLLISLVIAIYDPAKRIKNLTIVVTIMAQ